MSSSESSNSGVAASGDGGKFGSPAGAIVLQHAHPLFAGQEKQKMLLSSETGHFSLVRLVLSALCESRYVAHSNFVQGVASC